jgi:hypothetical protein
MITSSDDFSNSSSPPKLLSRLELSPHIYIFSYLPKCIRQLGNLCILNIRVRKLISDDLEIVRGLPNLAVFSLYIHTKLAERIVIGKRGFSVFFFANLGFSVLKCFKF